ncbi:MAG TPA: hypothetical protein ENH23_04135, partial [candidate division Zixibacteria bacterium]|nr:hypothetical protein [candidate division Zixibacteria bacterium]
MKPWTSGPRELLEHAIEHFEKGSAFDYRISFISIDNSVELMIKTYLGLPKRIRKSEGPSRRKLSEASNSFPELLDLLDEFGSEKIEGVDLGDIEWYHRIRNTLYHDGNGVTVDSEKVDSYLQISVILFNSLFEEEFNSEAPLEPASVVGEIVLRSSQLEHNLNILYRERFPEEGERRVPIIMAVERLTEKGILPEKLAAQINESRKIRN